MTESAFAQAASRVVGGADPVAEAAGLVASMTAAEQRWCLDGDWPFWGGLGFAKGGDRTSCGFTPTTRPSSSASRLSIDF